jgi:hypothetical protein
MRKGRGVLLFWLAVTACANEDVVLFDFRGGGGAGMAGMPSTGGASTGGSVGSGDTTTAGDAPNAGAGDSTNTESPCQSNVDCPIGWICEKASCTAPTGSCTYPVCFDQAPQLVCGCDGVTYWNDCLRKHAGQAASTAGQCTSSVTRCRDAADCSSTSNVCGHLFASADACGDGMFGQRGPGPDPQGNPPVPGTCWSMPASCDATIDTLRWSECGAAAPMTCLDTCNALSTGRFFVQSPAGTCP